MISLFFDLTFTMINDGLFLEYKLSRKGMTQPDDMNTKLKVPVVLAQELAKDIRILARSGKGPFSHYLVMPLSNAGWQTASSGLPSRKMMERIRTEAEDPSFLHTIGPKCKRLISAAMNENFSSLGDASIFFLEKMQLHVKVSSSPESIEFAGIISPSLSQFRAINAEKNESKFRTAITSLNGSQLKSSMEPVRLEKDTEKVKMGSEIRSLYDNILIASKYNNLAKCRKLLSGYIIRYSDDPEYAAADVERLIKALDQREENFSIDIREFIAIELYYQITQGVLNGNLAAAIQAIRKYGYFFAGDTTAKYYYDIDRLERILYQMLTDKGLWNDIKNSKG